MMDNYLDKEIKESLKEMIESDVPIDVEKSWEDFERRLREDEKKNKPKQKLHNKYLLALVAVIALAIITTPLLSPNKVTAFKDKIYRSLTNDDNGATILTDRLNTIKKGDYSNITLEEAQSLTVQHLLYPKYLPNGIEHLPLINVTVGEKPYSLSTMTFKGKNKVILLKQENIVGERLNRTYIPKGIEVEKKELFNDGIQFLIMENSDNDYRLDWIKNSVQYTLVTKNINFQEITKIIKNMY